MIHRLIGLAVVVVVIIIGLTMYLAPDDLAKCSGPGTSECAAADAIVAVSGGDTDARTDEASCQVRQLIRRACPMLRL